MRPSVAFVHRWQLRQSGYTGSVQRWRNYERQLAPLVEILAPLLPEEPAAFESRTDRQPDSYSKL